MVRSRAQEGRRVSSKSPSRVQDQDEGVSGKNRRELLRVIVCSLGKTMIFIYNKLTTILCQVPDLFKMEIPSATSNILPRLPPQGIQTFEYHTH